MGTPPLPTWAIPTDLRGSQRSSRSSTTMNGRTPLRRWRHNTTCLRERLSTHCWGFLRWVSSLSCFFIHVYIAKIETIYSWLTNRTNSQAHDMTRYIFIEIPNDKYKGYIYYKTFEHIGLYYIHIWNWSVNERKTHLFTSMTSICTKAVSTWLNDVRGIFYPVCS